MSQKSQNRRTKKIIGNVIGGIIWSVMALTYIGLGLMGVFLQQTGAYSYDAGEADFVTGGPAIALGIVYIIFGLFILVIIAGIYIDSKRKPVATQTRETRNIR